MTRPCRIDGCRRSGFEKREKRNGKGHVRTSTLCYAHAQRKVRWGSATLRWCSGCKQAVESPEIGVGTKWLCDA